MDKRSVLMISRYLEYSQPQFANKVLAAGNKTILVFSRLKEVICLDGKKVGKLNQIFELLQEKAEEDDDDEKCMLYGTLVDTFEEENYFVNHREEKIEERNLIIKELATMPNQNDALVGETYSNETLIAFGYLNSKDLYLQPNDLKLLIHDFKWFVNESERCKKETAVFIENLIEKMESEIRFIQEGKPHVNLFVCGL